MSAASKEKTTKTGKSNEAESASSSMSWPFMSPLMGNGFMSNGMPSIMGNGTDIASEGANVFSALGQATSAAMEESMALMQEYGAFVSNRLKTDMEAAKTLSECRTPEDYLRVQTAFLEDAVRDYTDEAGRMTQLMVEGAQKSLKPIEENGGVVPKFMSFAYSGHDED